MRIRSSIQLLSSTFIGLPILAVLWFSSRLPNQIPLHFDEEGQVDHLGTRQEWLTSLLWSVFLFQFMRILFLGLVNRETHLPDANQVKLHVLTAVLVMCASALLIGQGIWGISLYREWLPVVFFLFGSVFIYYGVPPSRHTLSEEQLKSNRLLVRQLVNRRRIQTLTRSVTMRVNGLAVLLMLFVRGQDRWSMGILANLLVYVYIAGLAYYLDRTGK